MQQRKPIARISYSAALDNYEPTRRHAYGLGLVYGADDVRDEAIVLNNYTGREATNAVYLIDDGRTVEVWYVAGWKQDASEVFLHRMPTNYNADGTPRLRADDGRPVSFDNWLLGPRTAYHLKVTRENIEGGE